MGRPLDEDAIQRLLDQAEKELDDIEQTNVARNQRIVWIRQERQDEEEVAEDDIDALEGGKAAEERLLEEGITSQQEHDEAIRDIDSSIQKRVEQRDAVFSALDHQLEKTIENFNETAKAIRTKRGEVQRYESMLEAIDETANDGADEEMVEVVDEV